MQYHLEQTQTQFNQSEKLKFLFFWGHQKPKNNQITKSCFSQWWEGEFKAEGVKYRTAEHWMMAQKAILFKDEEMLRKILQSNNPGEAKKLGRKVRGFDQELWEAHRYEIVKAGNYYKFKKDKALKEFLLGTNDRILVEASPVDRIWGIGMAADHPTITNPNTWKGLNLLGYALMEVRDQLRGE